MPIWWFVSCLNIITSVVAVHLSREDKQVVAEPVHIGSHRAVYGGSIVNKGLYVTFEPAADGAADMSHGSCTLSSRQDEVA